MRCPGCSHHNPADNRFCERCGVPLGVPQFEADEPRPGEPRYGGFAPRFGAWVIDSAIVHVLGAIASLPVFMAMSLRVDSDGTADTGALMVGQLAGFAFARVVAWLYEAGMNSSSRQATLGKLALKLHVTDLEGQRITFVAATKRHFASYLSTVVLFAGYLIQPAMKRKQTLHDLLAETLVVERGTRRGES